MRISIPEPCNESWKNMTPKEKGRLCGVCSKVVVDFTKMSKDEMTQYFINRGKEKTCGRFLGSQLTISKDVNRYPKVILSKFAFVLYVVFGMTLFSCGQGSNVHLIGEIEKINYKDTSTIHVDSTRAKVDSILPAVVKENQKPPKTCAKKNDTIITGIIKGDISIEPDPIFLGEPDIEPVLMGAPMILPDDEIPFEENAIKEED